MSFHSRSGRPSSLASTRTVVLLPQPGLPDKISSLDEYGCDSGCDEAEEDCEEDWEKEELELKLEAEGCEVCESNHCRTRFTVELCTHTSSSAAFFGMCTSLHRDEDPAEGDDDDDDDDDDDEEEEDDEEKDEVEEEAELEDDDEVTDEKDDDAKFEAPPPILDFFFGGTLLGGGIKGCRSRLNMEAMDMVFAGAEPPFNEVDMVSLRPFSNVLQEE